MDPAKAIIGALFFFSGLLLAASLPLRVHDAPLVAVIGFGIASVLFMYSGAKAWMSAMKSMDKRED